MCWSYSPTQNSNDNQNKSRRQLQTHRLISSSPAADPSKVRGPVPLRSTRTSHTTPKKSRSLLFPCLSWPPSSQSWSLDVFPRHPSLPQRKNFSVVNPLPHWVPGKIHHRWRTRTRRAPHTLPSRLLGIPYTHVSSRSEWWNP